MTLGVRAVTRSFGGVRALDGVDLDVADGELVGLIGPNGAGKTTLLDILTGFTVLDSGQVTLAGVEITRMAPHRRAALGMARTFQTARLFGAMTSVENVVAGMHTQRRDDTLARMAMLPSARRADAARHRRAETLLERVGLAGAGDRLASTLSYGDQRRLEIARALALEPCLLLLDEPAAGMNAGETAGIRTLLERLRAEGLAMVLVEHHLDLVVSTCDRIAVLDFGRMIASGPPDEVVAQPAVVEAYLGRAGATAQRAGA